ncbi:MAG: hypothetical protein AAGB19_04040 [Cyanobacteria bacterium P01_F01_bin.3]
MPLLSAPIEIGDDVWITADVFVGPGVYIGEGAVVKARSSVLESLDPWGIYAGSPAKLVRARTLK